MREIKTELCNISPDEFNELYIFKSHCESNKSCATCVIGKENCKVIATIGKADDISCMEIGKVDDAYYAFSLY